MGRNRVYLGNILNDTLKEKEKRKNPRKTKNKQFRNDTEVVMELGNELFTLSNFFITFIIIISCALTSLSDFSAVSLIFLGNIHTIATCRKPETMISHDSDHHS